MSFDKNFKKVLYVSCAASLALHGTATGQSVDKEPLGEVLAQAIEAEALKEEPAYLTHNYVTEKDIEIAAKGNLGDLLEELPMAAFYGDGRNVNNGSFGINTVNLRGLGSDRQLTMLNGRRISSVGSGIQNHVDLSIIPPNAISQVEILSNGASAVFGADAMTGIINFVTRKEFDGVELTARAGQSESGDGERYSLGASWGQTIEKGWMSAHLHYEATEPVFQSDREISNCPRMDPGQALWIGSFPSIGTGGIYADPLNSCSGSSYTPAGRFYLNRFGGFSSFTLDSSGNFRPYDFYDGDAYNFNPDNYLRAPGTTFSAYASGEYEISDEITAGVELLYNKRTSSQQLAPVPFGQGVQFGPGIFIPGSNPFNPLATDIAYRRRAVEVGPRQFEQESETIRTVLSLNGSMFNESDIPFFGGANWELSWSGDFNNGSENKNNLIDMFRLEQALNVAQTTTSGAGTVTVGANNYYCSDPVARSLGCVPINLFGEGAISAEAADYIRLDAVDKFGSQGQVGSLILSNKLFELPAGDVSAVLGVERRSYQGDINVDAAIANGLASELPANSTSGDVKAWDYFTEIEVPLFKNHKNIGDLTLNGAYRISDYDVFDVDDTYRLHVAWSPVEPLRFSGGLSTSFRSLSISELYNGGAGGYVTIVDPRPGIPSFPEQVPVRQRGAQLVGSELAPETAKTKNFGVVFEPVTGWLAEQDFFLSVHYLDIEITDLVVTNSAQAVINQCFIAGDPQACSQITLNGGSIAAVDTSFLNADADVNERAKNIDFSFGIQKEIGAGLLGVNVKGTHILDLYSEAGGIQSDRKGICAGFTGSCSNDWRINARVSYEKGGLQLAWSTRFLSAINKNSSTSRFGILREFELIDAFNSEYGVDVSGLTEAYFIDDYFYHDLYTAYELDNGVELSFGVDNVLDKTPPFHKYALDFFDPTANTPVGTYDTLGRFFYVGLSADF